MFSPHFPRIFARYNVLNDALRLQFRYLKGIWTHNNKPPTSSLVIRQVGNAIVILGKPRKKLNAGGKTSALGHCVKGRPCRTMEQSLQWDTGIQEQAGTRLTIAVGKRTNMLSTSMIDVRASKP